jgi:hypothetical protein
MLALSAISRRFEPRSKQTKDLYNWYLLILPFAHNIKQHEQILVVSESGQYVQVERHLYRGLLFQ